MGVRERGLRTWESVRDTWGGRLVERIALDLARLEVFDRAMTLAAQAFTSIVPLMLVAATVRPRQPGFGSLVADSLGLSDQTRAALAGSVPTDATAIGSIGAFSILVALLSATSFSRALERVYLRTWGVHKASVRTAWRWLATVLAVVLAVLAIAFTRSTLEGDVWRGTVAAILAVAVWTALWTFVPWMLLQRQVPVRILVFTAALTAICLGVLNLAGSIYLPLAMEAGARQFGVLGLVFAYIGWLFAIALVIVATTVIGRACAESDGPIGRVVRGASGSGGSGVTPASGD
ncbi:YhjD/YihY/BrkB family envelope integrity protein [Cellulomonas edaphi]|uniref:YhjD/YihY/BrkB family envelope integrity protein n=1 Tax=Cellulomonas edaphi TaxID=3053468 RepID=A0ABT7S3Y1_9CELL|nr:YhjD/YihY/BrkB family envelope integrity protein [Cellulomons edaphi]MDM7830327.1 YhjD/YihY/BrkB family envelope integrity protein [Cellulomons edaphi]